MENHVSKLHSYFHPWMGHIRSARSIPPSPHPSRSQAPHEDEGTAQPKHRMRRPAPPSIQKEREIKPFEKKPITFMFHATYGNQLFSIMEHGLKSGKSQSNPSGRTHVHMACIDDVILDDDESEAALTHVPAGRDALLILAFLKDQDCGIRLSEERTALTDKTIEARNIVAAFEPDGSLMASNKWIMECERASLAHVDPDVNLGEEEFFFPHRGECPTIDEYKQAQPGSGYPVKLPLGLKKLRSHDGPEIIRAYAVSGSACPSTIIIKASNTTACSSWWKCVLPEVPLLQKVRHGQSMRSVWMTIA